MEFEKACNEVDFILNHLNPDDRKKLPESLINFFKENKDIFYEVNIDTSKSLYDQKLKEETKVFLQIIKETYFSNDEEKNNSKQLANLKEDENQKSIEDFNVKNRINIEQEKSNDNIINDNIINDKQEKENKKIINVTQENKNNNEMIVYKESKLKSFIKKIINIFKLDI